MVDMKSIADNGWEISANETRSYWYSDQWEYLERNEGEFISDKEWENGGMDLNWNDVLMPDVQA